MSILNFACCLNIIAKRTERQAINLKSDNNAPVYLSLYADEGGVIVFVEGPGKQSGAHTSVIISVLSTGC